MNQSMLQAYALTGRPLEIEIRQNIFSAKRYINLLFVNDYNFVQKLIKKTDTPLLSR